MPPLTLVPEGTTIAVRHFLSVPSCQEVEEAAKGGEGCHSILKVTRSMKKKLDMEVVYSEGNISSPYISTDKFQKKPLCKVLVVWRPWGDSEKTRGDSEKAECLHASPKKIVITKHMDVCGHQPNALAVYCHCESAESDFKDIIKENSHEPARIVMRQNIEKNDSISYNIAIKLEGSEGEEEERTVSHLALCKNNGVLQLGRAIHSQFGCTCHSFHCGGHREVSITTTNSATREDRKFSNILLCDKSKCGQKVQTNQSLGVVHRAPASSAEDAQTSETSAETELKLNQIMEEEIIKPHRQGNDLYISILSKKPCSGFAQDLAYKLGIGEEFDNWANAERRYATARVRSNPYFKD